MFENLRRRAPRAGSVGGSVEHVALVLARTDDDGAILDFVASFTDTDVTWTLDAAAAHVFEPSGDPAWGAHKRPSVEGFHVYADGEIAGDHTHRLPGEAD